MFVVLVIRFRVDQVRAARYTETKINKPRQNKWHICHCIQRVCRREQSRAKTNQNDKKKKE